MQQEWWRNIPAWTSSQAKQTKQVFGAVIACRIFFDLLHSVFPSLLSRKTRGWRRAARSRCCRRKSWTAASWSRWRRRRSCLPSKSCQNLKPWYEVSACVFPNLTWRKLGSVQSWLCKIKHSCGCTDIAHVSPDVPLPAKQIDEFYMASVPRRDIRVVWDKRQLSESFLSCLCWQNLLCWTLVTSELVLGIVFLGGDLMFLWRLVFRLWLEMLRCYHASDLMQGTNLRNSETKLQNKTLLQSMACNATCSPFVISRHWLVPLGFFQILVKSILRQKSFRNPFSPGHYTRDRHSSYKKNRSNSAPESYDHMRWELSLSHSLAFCFSILSSRRLFDVTLCFWCQKTLNSFSVKQILPCLPVFAEAVWFPCLFQSAFLSVRLCNWIISTQVNSKHLFFCYLVFRLNKLLAVTYVDDWTTQGKLSGIFQPLLMLSKICMLEMIEYVYQIWVPFLCVVRHRKFWNTKQCTQWSLEKVSERMYVPGRKHAGGNWFCMSAYWPLLATFGPQLFDPPGWRAGSFMKKRIKMTTHV